MTFAVTSCTSTTSVSLAPEATSPALPRVWADPGDYLDIVPGPAGWTYTNNGVYAPVVREDESPDCLPQISGELEGTANWFAPNRDADLNMLSMSAESFEEPGGAQEKVELLNQMVHECSTLQLGGAELSMRPLDLTALGHPGGGFEGVVVAMSSAEQWSTWVAKDNLLVTVWVQPPASHDNAVKVGEFLTAALGAFDA